MFLFIACVSLTYFYIIYILLLEFEDDDGFNYATRLYLIYSLFLSIRIQWLWYSCLLLVTFFCWHSWQINALYCHVICNIICVYSFFFYACRIMQIHSVFGISYIFIMCLKLNQDVCLECDQFGAGKLLTQCAV